MSVEVGHADLIDEGAARPTGLGLRLMYVLFYRVIAAMSPLRLPVDAVDFSIMSGRVVGEIRRDGLGLLQNRHLRAQPRIAHQCADVERRGYDDTADVAPFRGRLGFRSGVVDCFPTALARQADAQIDATGMKGIEDAKAFDDGDGRRLSELYRGGADPNRVGGGGDLTDEYRGLRGCDGDEVVFGDPVALVAPLLGVLGKVDGVA